MTILSNKKNQLAVLHFTASNTTTIAGNSSVSGIAVGDESLTGGYVKGLAWTGTWTIARGANTIWSTINSGDLDFTSVGMPLTQDATATLVCTLTGSGSILVKVGKIGHGSSDY